MSDMLNMDLVSKKVSEALGRQVTLTLGELTYDSITFQPYMPVFENGDFTPRRLKKTRWHPEIIEDLRYHYEFWKRQGVKDVTQFTDEMIKNEIVDILSMSIIDELMEIPNEV